MSVGSVLKHATQPSQGYVKQDADTHQIPSLMDPLPKSNTLTTISHLQADLVSNRLKKNLIAGKW